MLGKGFDVFPRLISLQRQGPTRDKKEEEKKKRDNNFGPQEESHIPSKF
jgi:hypothetical protein